MLITIAVQVLRLPRRPSDNGGSSDRWCGFPGDLRRDGAGNSSGWLSTTGWETTAKCCGVASVVSDYATPDVPQPHGDTAIYDTLVRLAQPWVMRYPLVSGQGNFGSAGNDKAAAMRYTECKMAPLAAACPDA